MSRQFSISRHPKNKHDEITNTHNRNPNTSITHFSAIFVTHLFIYIRIQKTKKEREGERQGGRERARKRERARESARKKARQHERMRG